MTCFTRAASVIAVFVTDVALTKCVVIRRPYVVTGPGALASSITMTRPDDLTWG